MKEESSGDRRKLWNGNKTQAKLEVSLYGKQNAINIGKDVLRVIGAPTHITIKINKEMDSFIVMPCEGKAPMSFRVPENIMLDRHKQMKITSQSFVIGLLSVNGLEIERTYKIEGIYSEKNNAVVFNMSDCWIYGEKKEGV